MYLPCYLCNTGFKNVKIHIRMNPQNMTLLGSRIFASGIKLRWGHIGSRWSLTQMASLWEGHTDPGRKQRQRLEWHSYKPRNINNCQEPLEARKMWGSISPKSLQKEYDPVDILISDFWIPNLWGNKFLVLSHTMGIIRCGWFREQPTYLSFSPHCSFHNEHYISAFIWGRSLVLPGDLRGFYWRFSYNRKMQAEQSTR